jgi:hypothetical protein
MNFKHQYQQEFNQLTHLFNYCKSTEDDFKKRWQSGIKRLGVSQYKLSHDYKHSLDERAKAYHAANRVINELLVAYKHKNFINLAHCFAYLDIPIKIYGSGYMKEALCKALKHANFTASEQQVLEDIIIEQISSAGREFNGFVKLLPCICSSTIKERLLHHDDGGKRYRRERIERMLMVMS